jgi:hypothetical protein
VIQGRPWWEKPHRSSNRFKTWGERATLSTSSYDRRQSYEREKIFVIVE